jgi:hypothetical protein
MRRFVPVVLLLSLAGCTTAIPPYVGRGGQELFLAWGSPVQTSRIPGGGQEVTFLRDNCLTTFVMDDAGVVRSGSARGDGCTR